MKSLRARITGSFLLLIGCAVLVTGIFVALLLRSSYLGSLTARLEKEGVLLAETIRWESVSQEKGGFQRWADAYGRTLNARVMFFDANGRVLGDSDRPGHAGEGLPEVKSALEGSGSDRSVVRDNELHTAVPVVRNGKTIGAIRLSLKADEINRSIRRVWFSLALGLLIAYALAAFFSSRIVRGVTVPLEEITEVAVDISLGRLHRRVQWSGYDEVAQLGVALNRMAHSLEKQMETIRKSERRLNSIIETMESGVLMVDATGQISLANRAFERLFGIPAAELVGTSYQTLTYPADLSELIERCAESGERMRREIHLYYPEERMLDAHLSPMWVEKNGVGVVAVFHDLTAIRRLEQLRKDFVANVSHELKTPVTSILGFAETLLDGAIEDQETCREFLEIIHAESLRLQRLVGDLLDLSRIESKQFQLKLERVDIGELVRLTAKTLEERIREKEQELTIQVPEKFEAEVDPDRFRQILVNLLSNAMAYTPRGGSIHVSVQPENERFVLKVADTGIGIPPEDLPRIFERFYRVDKARSRDSGGTGLGLAIVKHLVEAHNGEIQVESSVGKGTVFTVVFPSVKHVR
jgi:two-component system phosphate regulon sensor histidine kinase PhoR